MLKITQTKYKYDYKEPYYTYSSLGINSVVGIDSLVGINSSHGIDSSDEAIPSEVIPFNFTQKNWNSQFLFLRNGPYSRVRHLRTKKPEKTIKP